MGFMDNTVAENVYAGNAMNRRAFYQYGVLLPVDPFGYVTQGLGQSTSRGAVTLIPPTRIVSDAFEEIEVDGIPMVFQNTPDTEAPSETNTWIPSMKAPWMAENVTHGLHNIYMLRGAPVRDALNWSKYIAEALYRFGTEAEVMRAAHHWPRWGTRASKRCSAPSVTSTPTCTTRCCTTPTTGSRSIRPRTSTRCLRPCRPIGTCAVMAGRHLSLGVEMLRLAFAAMQGRGHRLRSWTRPDRPERRWSSPHRTARKTDSGSGRRPVVGEGLFSHCKGALVSLVSLVGAFHLGFGLLRLGRLIRFVSNAVMTGFITCIAFLIMFGSIPDITGLSSDQPNQNEDGKREAAPLRRHVFKTNGERRGHRSLGGRDVLDGLLPVTRRSWPARREAGCRR